MEYSTEFAKECFHVLVTSLPSCLHRPCHRYCIPKFIRYRIDDDIENWPSRLLGERAQMNHIENPVVQHFFHAITLRKTNLSYQSEESGSTQM